MAASDDASTLPNLPEVLGRVLARVPAERQPLLLALAERLAAERYRAWASDPSQAAHADGLRACATREEQIAEHVEALHPDAASIQREIRAASPDLEEINRSLFAGRPLPQQFAIQAQGERLGAATWRAFATQAKDAPTRVAFLACAALEEESARFLEGLRAAAG